MNPADVWQQGTTGFLFIYASPMEVCLLKQKSWRQREGLMVHLAVAFECYLQNDNANPSFGGDAFGKSHGLQRNIAKSILTVFFSYGLL